MSDDIEREKPGTKLRAGRTSVPPARAVQTTDQQRADVLDASSLNSDEMRAALVSISRSQTHIGPLPPPEQLAGYEKVLAGSAERFLKLWETETSHRRNRELDEDRISDRFIATQEWSTKAGAIFGFLIGVIGLVISWDLAKNGQPEVAGVIAAFDITGLAGVFVYGVRSQAAKMPKGARSVEDVEDDEDEPEESPPAPPAREQKKKGSRRRGK